MPYSPACMPADSSARFRSGSSGSSSRVDMSAPSPVAAVAPLLVLTPGADVEHELALGQDDVDAKLVGVLRRVAGLVLGCHVGVVAVLILVADPARLLEFVQDSLRHLRCNSVVPDRTIVLVTDERGDRLLQEREHVPVQVHLTCPHGLVRCC